MTKQNDGIDWEEQWRNFAPSFYDGVSHIDLSPYACNGSFELLLKPGGGFGDLSHPTTRLSLKLMAPLIKETTVVDIGCGSGILMLSALLMGAKIAIGIDIDEAALEHAQANAQLNHLEKKAIFVKQANRFRYKTPLVLVMNMIFSEQKVAWGSQATLHRQMANVVTSGILTEQREAYLAWTSQIGWKLLKEEAEEQWSGFVFSQNAPSF